MQNLPTELICKILDFLPNESLIPINRELKPIYFSNIVWKPRVLKKIGNIESENYIKEYQWHIKMEKHKFNYKRAYTYGCIGKNVPLKKPIFEKSYL